MRRSLWGGFALVLSLVTLLIPSSASAAWPSHAINGPVCEYSPNGNLRVRATPPRQMNPWRYSRELVYWSPDLQKWSYSRRRGHYVWRTVDGSAPWFYATTNMWHGLEINQTFQSIWVEYRRNLSTLFWPFYGVRHNRYYRIKNWLEWDAVGWTHKHFSGWCH